MLYELTGINWDVTQNGDEFTTTEWVYYHPFRNIQIKVYYAPNKLYYAHVAVMGDHRFYVWCFSSWVKAFNRSIEYVYSQTGLHATLPNQWWRSYKGKYANMNQQRIQPRLGDTVTVLQTYLDWYAIQQCGSPKVDVGEKLLLINKTSNEYILQGKGVKLSVDLLTLINHFE